MSNIPVGYNDLNVIYSEGYPSVVKAANTQLTRYFKRYLLQRAINVFDFCGLPDSWDADYFKYCLFGYGYIAVINTDKYGVIPQQCGLSGYNIYYRPTNVVVTNPLIRNTLRPRIGEECALIKLQPDYGNVMDLVQYYAEMLATCSETLALNIFNSKLSYVMGAEGKGAAETFKALFDKVASGEPAVAVSKDLFGADGKPTWTMFSQNVGQNYIADRLLNDMRNIISMFDSDIGIPNANTQKRERLITDEVAANRVETYILSDLWLKTIRRGLEDANRLFALNLTVDYSFGGDLDACYNDAVRVGAMG